MSIIKQVLLLAVLVAVAAGGVVGYERYLTPNDTAAGLGAGRASRAIQVQLVTTAERIVERRIEAVGTTLANQSVEIVPLTSGRVVELAFTPGDRVAEGAVLVRLDDDIERADFAEAEAKLEEAENALERARTLRESNTVSRASLELLTATAAAARAQVDRARRRLADRTVRAPFAGHVGMRRVDLGARIDDDTTITTLDDLSEIKVEFALPETVFAQVKPGLTVAADSVAFPNRRFEGKVETIDSRIDATSRSFKVRAVLPNPEYILPAGMFMHLAVVLDTRSAIMIPEEAVVVEGDTVFVFVVDDDRAERREVSLGTREPGAVEITDGLAVGEAIVVRGVQRLRDGMAVQTAATPPAGGGRDGTIPEAAGAGSTTGGGRTG